MKKNNVIKHMLILECMIFITAQCMEKKTVVTIQEIEEFSQWATNLGQRFGEKLSPEEFPCYFMLKKNSDYFQKKLFDNGFPNEDDNKKLLQIRQWSKKGILPKNSLAMFNVKCELGFNAARQRIKEEVKSSILEDFDKELREQMKISKFMEQSKQLGEELPSQELYDWISTLGTNSGFLFFNLSHNTPSNQTTTSIFTDFLLNNENLCNAYRLGLMNGKGKLNLNNWEYFNLIFKLGFQLMAQYQ